MWAVLDVSRGRHAEGEMLLSFQGNIYTVTLTSHHPGLSPGLGPLCTFSGADLSVSSSPAQLSSGEVLMERGVEEDRVCPLLRNCSLNWREFSVPLGGLLDFCLNLLFTLFHNGFDLPEKHKANPAVNSQRSPDGGRR